MAVSLNAKNEPILYLSITNEFCGLFKNLLLDQAAKSRKEFPLFAENLPLRDGLIFRAKLDIRELWQ
jgi:hypothetical protein